MKANVNYLIGVLVLLLVIIAAGCGSTTSPAPSIVGNWRYSETWLITFSADNSYRETNSADGAVIVDFRGTYSVQGDQLTTIRERDELNPSYPRIERTEPFQFTDSNTIILSDITLKRQ